MAAKNRRISRVLVEAHSAKNREKNREERVEKNYKCLAPSSISKPSEVLVETGMLPLSLFILKSNQDSWVKFPMEAGIDPLKLFEFNDLHNSYSKLATYI